MNEYLKSDLAGVSLALVFDLSQILTEFSVTTTGGKGATCHHPQLILQNLFATMQRRYATNAEGWHGRVGYGSQP
jgi:hypothetical protein